jgi:acetyltransferase-like isoleucine patch superfamily enzyme
MTKMIDISEGPLKPNQIRNMGNANAIGKFKFILKRYISLFKTCNKSKTSFLLVLFREFYFRLFHNLNLWLHPSVKINGAKNIQTNGTLSVGISYVGFTHKSDKTVLNILGTLKINGDFSIGKGCRFDIGSKGEVIIGKGGYITANSYFIIMHKLIIGDNCAISWDCQFLDEDFHEIIYDKKRQIDPSIRIGNHVWIGCGVKIYKGSTIPDNCVVASNSVIKGKFTTQNALIGGNPARILKENIHWK